MANVLDKEKKGGKSENESESALLGVRQGNRIILGLYSINSTILAHDPL